MRRFVLKKTLGVFCLFVIILSSNIFGKSLLSTVYDNQGNEISLYDDNTWIMNDKSWNNAESDSQIYGKYIIKEKGILEFSYANHRTLQT